MSTLFKRTALLIALAAAVAACGKKEEAATPAAPAPVAAPTVTPDAAVLAAVRALRGNDLNAFFLAALPPSEVAKIKSDWANKMNEDPITDEDRKKFADQMAKFTAPGAEDKLFAEAEPQLKKLDAQAAQIPMMIAMGQGFLQSAIQQNQDLTDEQKKQSAAVVDAAAKWAQGVKFTDPALAKAAIAAVSKTARDLNLKSLDEVRALNYDQGMAKAGIALAGAKQIAGAYGLKIDQWLDSVKAETVSTTGDAAKVKVTYTAFDQPFTTESDLVKVDGKWFGKQAVEKWQKEQAAETAAAANPQAPAKPDAAQSK
jgi:predicted small lipoprotein YifL